MIVDYATLTRFKYLPILSAESWLRSVVSYENLPRAGIDGSRDLNVSRVSRSKVEVSFEYLSRSRRACLLAVRAVYFLPFAVCGCLRRINMQALVRQV